MRCSELPYLVWSRRSSDPPPCQVPTTLPHRAWSELFEGVEKLLALPRAGSILALLALQRRLDALHNPIWSGLVAHPSLPPMPWIICRYAASIRATTCGCGSRCPFAMRCRLLRSTPVLRCASPTPSALIRCAVVMAGLSAWWWSSKSRLAVLQDRGAWPVMLCIDDARDALSTCSERKLNLQRLASLVPFGAWRLLH